MATLPRSSLPTPDSLVVGSGSYTVPANRYGYFSANASATFYKSGTLNGTELNAKTASSTGTAAASSQWIPAGTSITVSTSFPSVTDPADGNTGATFGAVATAIVNLNAIPAVRADAGFVGSSIGTATGVVANSTGGVGWSVALFRIPKGNLPVGAAEGE